MQTMSLMQVLKQLLAYANLTANALAKSLDLPTPTIHRLVTGEVQDPRISTLTLIADYFNISIDQLLGRQALDSRFHSKSSAQKIKPPFSIPLLTMHQAHALSKNMKTASNWFRWQSISGDCDYDHLFSIQIKNNLYEPVFIRDTYIIFDASMHPESGDYVLVNFDGDSVPILKRYISEGKNKFLLSMNTDGKTEKFNAKESTVIRVAIEVCRSFKV
jgi:SOS-response transcriptional repressor LexA